MKYLRLMGYLLLLVVSTSLLPSVVHAICVPSDCSTNYGGSCVSCSYTTYYYCGYPDLFSQQCSTTNLDTCCKNENCTVCDTTGFCSISGCPPQDPGGGGDPPPPGSTNTPIPPTATPTPPILGTARARAMTVAQTATSCADVTGSTNYIPASFTLTPPGTGANAAGTGDFATWSTIVIPQGGDTYSLSPSVASQYVMKLACWDRDAPAGSGTGLAASMSQNGSTLTWNVGYTLGTPWVQADGGDVYAATTLRSFVPANAAPRVFVTDGTGGDPGVVTYGTSYDFDSASGQGGSYVSSANWLVNTSVSSANYYDYFYNRYGAPVTPSTAAPFDNLLAVTEPAGSDTPYYVVGDMTTSGNWSVGSGETVVILLDGNLTINGRINVTGTGFIAFIVSGNITVSDTVGTTSSSTTPVVEGVYVTSPTGTFSTGSSTAAGSARFVGEGMFVAGSFQLQRDLENYGDNSAYAAELFIYNPGLLLSMPQGMMELPVKWQEVAP